MFSIICYLKEFLRAEWIKKFLFAKTPPLVTPPHYRDFPRLTGKECSHELRCMMICPVPGAIEVLKDENAPRPNSDLFEEARVCFNRLWKEDKLKARVHYLKTVSEMSSRDIMRLLNISSEANVNQLFSRACRLMRMYREELRQVPTGNEKEVLYALS